MSSWVYLPGALREHVLALLPERDLQSLRCTCRRLSTSGMPKLTKAQKKERKRVQHWRRKRERQKQLRAQGGGKNNSQYGINKKLLGKPLDQVAWHKPVVAIDLSFIRQLPVKERRSVVTQVAYSYAFNRRSDRPLELHLCGIDSEAHQSLDKGSDSCYKSWQMFQSDEPVLQCFDHQKIRYLSPESPNILQEFDEDCVYVIGGISDNQNQQKGATLALCEELGIQHCSLPLTQHMETLSTRATVLNINHVFEIISKISQGRSWTETLLETIPQRLQRLVSSKKKRKKEADEAADVVEAKASKIDQMNLE